MKIFAENIPTLVESFPVLLSIGLFRADGFCLTEGNVTDAKIRSQLLGSFFRVQTEQLGNKIDYVSVLMAAETIEAVIVNLEAGRIVQMKRTPGEVALVQLDPVKLCGLSWSNAPFHSVKD